MTTTNLEGTIGDTSCDGWVSWTTKDDGNSYLPSIACGAFELVIARGSHWTGHGVDESTGVIFVAPYDMSDENDEPLENVAEIKFAWSEVTFLRAVGDALAELEKLDLGHPLPQNVLEAARDLWVAMRLEGRERF